MFGDARFSSSKVAVRLGSPATLNRLDFGEVAGRLTARGVEGSFAGGDGKIANVPLLLSNARGRWQVVDGRSRESMASLTIADEASPARFHPLGSHDFHLTLEGNRARGPAAG